MIFNRGQMKTIRLAGILVPLLNFNYSVHRSEPICGYYHKRHS